MKTPTFVTLVDDAVLVLVPGDLGCRAAGCGAAPRSRRSRRPSRQPWRRVTPARRRSFSPRMPRLSVPGIEGVLGGRAAIEKFWPAALSGGLKALTLAATETDGRGDLRVETGTYTALGANRSELSRGQYLLVWKREDGAWKIHRDFGHADGAMTAAGSSGPIVSAFPPTTRQQLRKVSDTVFDEKFGVTTVFANELAASSPGFSQARYPNGSVILMEFAKPQARWRGRAVARCARHAAQGRDRAHRRHAARRRASVRRMARAAPANGSSRVIAPTAAR